MARREGFAVRCALYRIREQNPETKGLRVPEFRVPNGTPGGIREPASLACATKRSLVATPRPSGSKRDANGGNVEEIPLVEKIRVNPDRFPDPAILIENADFDAAFRLCVLNIRLSQSSFVSRDRSPVVTLLPARNCDGAGHRRAATRRLPRLMTVESVSRDRPAHLESQCERARCRRR